MTRALRLVSTQPAPAKKKAEPKRPPLISSEAQRREAEGLRFYDRARLKPKDLPSTYLALTSYPRRVQHHGTLTGHLVTILLAAAVAVAVALWVQS